MAGIYVHIPFCRKACTYCDFHFSTNLGKRKEIVTAIGQEAVLRQGFFHHTPPLETLYFGGGTPSLLEKDDWVEMLEAFHSQFKFAPGFEFTVECNPDDLTPDRLGQLADLGVNRLSIGIQSFREEDLSLMNRSHDARQAVESIQNALAVGFQNITVDLIYGIPGLSDLDWQTNVQQVIDLGIPHVSAYALTVEEKTVLAHQVAGGKVRVPEDEKYEGQFFQLIDQLEAEGYEHYELSNFAKPGYRSRHNSAYWKGESYLGLGPSAHSYHAGERSWNYANNAQYLKQISVGKDAIQEEEILTREDQINEFLMTQLRLSDGVNMNILREKYGHDAMQTSREAIESYIREGYAVYENGYLRLTRDGKMISNTIISELFVEEL